MKNIWFYSDPHFYHANIIDYCQRPFRDVLHMNNALIENFNSRVNVDDTVFMLGDFGFASIHNLQEIFKQLNGNLIAIKGNHDSSKKRLKLIGFVEVYDNLVYDSERRRYWEVENLNNIKDPNLIKMSHYPYLFDEAEVKNKSYLSKYPLPSPNILLHGHRHSARGQHLRSVTGAISYDVGVDSQLYSPINLNDILSEIEVFINL